MAEIDALVVSGAGRGLSARFHVDDEQGAPPNLVRLLDGHAPDTHFYCCGPGPMLDADERTCEQLGQTHVHLERFAAPAGAAAAARVGPMRLAAPTQCRAHRGEKCATSSCSSPG